MADAGGAPATSASAAASSVLRVQVCHALPDAAFLELVVVPPGSTIAQALRVSGLGVRFPELPPAIAAGEAKVGIFGKVKTPDTVLRDGDRIEIYRPLQADPKETRRRRAKHRELAQKDTGSRPAPG